MRSLYKPFNRTSMESKQEKVTVLFADNGTLLIEPVWNRNAHLFRCPPKIAMLLIEPVWNRNLAEGAEQEQPQTFNRTSMESKLNSTPGMSRKKFTFNRTSMESKLLVSHSFLIGSKTFNRTSMESKRRYEDNSSHNGILLIEPVWNRNL